eukprot:COSAG04_NODE_19_length_39217_cov_21.535968_11_plen_135_part_00
MGEAARGAQIKRGTTEPETAKTPEPGSMPERRLKPERSSRSCASQAGRCAHNGNANLIAVEMGEAARGAQIKRGMMEPETAMTPEPGSVPERKLKPELSSRSCARRAAVHNGNANRWRELGALLLMDERKNIAG